MKAHFLALLLCSYVNCAKILVINSVPRYSHFAVTSRLVQELAARDHDVTFINTFPQEPSIKNYREIIIDSEVPEEINKKNHKSSTVGVLDNAMFEFNFGLDRAELVLKDKKLQSLMDSHETYDVMIVGHFFNEALIGLAHHFKAPIILLSSVASGYRSNYLFANPAPPSYIPNTLSSFTKHMTFSQRLQNFMIDKILELTREIVFLPKQRELFKKYTKSDIQLDAILNNISLHLTNSHVSVNDPVPLVPHTIAIGGYHLNPPKQLPQDLQDYLDGAHEGVVLFSMGSILKSKDLPPEIRNSILRAFAKLDRKVLWKFETELPEAPENVKIVEWLPQQDVLAHPNVEAFVTHGGLLSVIEAVYYGVPLVGIPVFSDQKSNVAAAVHNGYAVAVLLTELTEEKFSWALNEVLNNPKYRENVQARSKLMRDQPLKPIDSAVYWIEHVIRHRGAPYLRSAGLDLNWYERDSVDVVGFLYTCAATLFIILFLIIKKLKKSVWTKEQSVPTIKKNI